MSTIKLILSGALLLLVGIAAGWFIKPASTDAMTDHSKHQNHQSVDTPESETMSEEIWTCSMHPQIRTNESGICPICEMDLIPLDNQLSNDDPTILMMSDAAVKLAQIETTIVGQSINQKKDSPSIEVEGSIELDERSVNAQSTHLSGRIENIAVTFEGQYIKAGQKIATIYSTDLLMASQELITASKFENRIEGIKEATIQKLKNWKISETQIGQILSEGKPIETIDIYAEHSGYVLNKKVGLGDYVKSGEPLYTVGSTNRLWLLFNVYESDLGNVQVGQKIEFSTPSTGDKIFKTRVSYVDPILDNSTRTAIVRADFTNSRNQLKPGMLLTGTIKKSIKSQDASGTITVPKSAVLWTGNNSVVYVQQKDSEVPSFQFREIEIGERSGQVVSVLKGLSQGEEIVTHGAFAIDAAAQLNNNRSMMNREVSIKKEVQNDITPDFQEITPEPFKKQLDDLADVYIDLKDDLVNTDAKTAAITAETVLSKLSAVDMALLTGEAHIYWMDQMNAIQSHGQKIASSEDVETQRKQFEHISDAIIRSIEAFGTSGKTYYVQFCPMANNNQGANWMSSQEQIQNPYFGDKMMKCGSVKRLIQ